MRNPFRRSAEDGALQDIIEWAKEHGITGPQKLHPAQQYALDRAMTAQGAHDGQGAWRRPSHWRVVFRPQGHRFATFTLLPDARWRYVQPENPAHVAVEDESLEKLMAVCELDWAAHWQVLRQADGHIALYNRGVVPSERLSH